MRITHTSIDLDFYDNTDTFIYEGNQVYVCKTLHKNRKNMNEKRNYMANMC